MLVTERVSHLQIFIIHMCCFEDARQVSKYNLFGLFLLSVATQIRDLGTEGKYYLSSCPEFGSLRIQESKPQTVFASDTTHAHEFVTVKKRWSLIQATPNSHLYSISFQVRRIKFVSQFDEINRNKNTPIYWM